MVKNHGLKLTSSAIQASLSLSLPLFWGNIHERSTLGSVIDGWWMVFDWLTLSTHCSFRFAVPWPARKVLPDSCQLVAGPGQESQKSREMGSLGKVDSIQLGYQSHPLPLHPNMKLDSLCPYCTYTWTLPKLTNKIWTNAQSHSPKWKLPIFHVSGSIKKPSMAHTCAVDFFATSGFSAAQMRPRMVTDSMKGRHSTHGTTSRKIRTYKLWTNINYRHL